MFNKYDIYGPNFETNQNVEPIIEKLKKVDIPEDYKFCYPNKIQKLKMGTGDAIFINDEYVTTINEHSMYFYDIVNYVKNGGTIEPTHTEEEIVSIEKNQLKSYIDSMVISSSLSNVTYNKKKYASDQRSRDAIMHTISTYRERLPIDDGQTLEEEAKTPELEHLLTTKLPLPKDFQWITLDNEYVNFKMADVLKLSALFQEKTYELTFKGREFKDKLAKIKTKEELEKFKQELEKYNWS